MANNSVPTKIGLYDEDHEGPARRIGLNSAYYSGQVGSYVASTALVTVGLAVSYKTWIANALRMKWEPVYAFGCSRVTTGHPTRSLFFERFE